MSASSIIRRIESDRNEERKIAKVLNYVDRESLVLDIGCGYGAKMRLLQSLGFKNIIGVERNASIIKNCTSSGLNVISIEELFVEYTNPTFDLLIISHVIEHMQWSELLDFLSRYIGLLKEGGHVLIVTPLLHKSFYDDLDHVKPYFPESFYQYYCLKGQIQVHPEIGLRLEDIYFRRTQFKMKFFRSLYLSSPTSIWRIVNFSLAMLFKCSFGLIGRKTGWVGLFRRL